MTYEKTVDKILNIIFAEDKTLFYLILIFLLAFLIRIIAAINLGVYADDMHFAPHAINFIASGKLETYDQSASLWFMVTDSFYKMFGTTQLASRLASILFGSFSVFLVYLLGKEFFDKKIALIGAFLLAVSPFAVKSMTAEMDPTTMFFVLFAMYFFVLALKREKNSFFLLAGVFIGLGILTKLYVLFFIPSLALYALYYNYSNKKKIVDSKIVKSLIIFGAAAFVFFIPTLAHNYLLYKYNGMMDLQFTRVFNLGRNVSEQYYGWDPMFTTKADFPGFFFGSSSIPLSNSWPTSLYALGFILDTDPILFILGFLGLIILFKRNRNYFWFFVLNAGIIFFYLASTILLSKHYLFLLLLLLMPAAYFVNAVIEKLSELKIKGRYIIIILLLLSLTLAGVKVYHASNSIYEKSPASQLMSWKSNIDKDALVVVDSRIYRGQITWLFSDKHYLEANYLQRVMDLQGNISGTSQSIPVYYIECVNDDCGWGTVKSQPEFNASMEAVTDWFKNSSQEIKVFDKSSNSRMYFPLMKKYTEWFAVYKTNMMLKPATLNLADSTHSFFLYPLAYNTKISPIFDLPEIKSYGDFLLYKFARVVQYLALILAFSSIVYLIYLFFKEE